MTGPKEAYYDEHIAPLMDEIIARCKAGRVPILASFELDANDDGPLFCTTAILDGNVVDSAEECASLRRGYGALFRRHQAFAITVTPARPGESKT